MIRIQRLTIAAVVTVEMLTAKTAIIVAANIEKYKFISLYKLLHNSFELQRNTE